MSNYAAFQFDQEDTNREATAQELAEVPRMSKAEAREIMRSKEYKSSRLVQQLIQAGIAKGYTDETAETGYESVEQLERRSTGDEFQAKKDAVAQMFKDPRYKTSAAYRYEVAQKVKVMTAGDENPDVNFHTPNQVISTTLSPMASKGSSLQVHKYGSIQLQAVPTPSEAPAKKPTREAFSE